MEQKLFIIGVIALVYYLFSKQLIKKGLLKLKKNMFVWNMFSMLIFSFVLITIFSVMVQNSGTGKELGFGFWFFCILLTTALLIFAFYQVHVSKSEKALNKIKYFNMEWFNTIYFAALLASVVMFFFIQAFKIPSSSMEKTLLKGDHLFVSKMTYGLKIPFLDKRFFPLKKIARGDIVIFDFPSNSNKEKYCGSPQAGKIFVKRVIAVGGDIVRISDKKTYVNGIEQEKTYTYYDSPDRHGVNLRHGLKEYQSLWEKRKLDKYYGIYLKDDFGPITVPAGNYFVMGDNRDHSCDSRFWGPVPEKNIKGSPLFIHWPINRIQLVNNK